MVSSNIIRILDIIKNRVMKNIHLVSTEKPSRLCIDNSCDELNYCDVEGLSTKHTKNQHIYITSDEEIKDGEYGICVNLVREGLKSHLAVFKMDCDQRHSIELLGGQKKAEILKVIMATDQDLIKDGVQAIDDEFLEWFVKNPSCEYVEVVNDLKYFNVDELRERYIKGLPHIYSEKIGDKIIIPQEESNQETLEEAAEKYVKSIFDNGIPLAMQNNFIAGAKWQAKRMYSEEEVHKIIENYQDVIENNPNHVTYHEWFEQFKKKQ